MFCEIVVVILNYKSTAYRKKSGKLLLVQHMARSKDDLCDVVAVWEAIKKVTTIQKLTISTVESPDPHRTAAVGFV